MAALLAAPEAMLATLLFASLRAGAALALLPGIGAMLVPLRVRIGLAAAIGVLVVTSRPGAIPALGLDAASLGAILFELAVGAAAGLLVQAAFAAASVAGELIAQAMGLGFAAIVGPGGASSPVVGQLLGLGMWAVFLGSGGLLELLALIVRSYDVLRPGGDAVALAEGVLRFGRILFAGGLAIALPIAAALLLVNLALAVAARSAPQLNLFAIGFPVLLLAGIALLPPAFPAMTAAMAHTLDMLAGALADLLG